MLLAVAGDRKEQLPLQVEGTNGRAARWRAAASSLFVPPSDGSECGVGGVKAAHYFHYEEAPPATTILLVVY